jgi:hypothetical protein
MLMSTGPVQGNCKAEIQADLTAHLGSPALLPLKPAQCLVLIDTTLVSLKSGDNLWLDGLYLREVATDRRMFAFVVQLFDPSELYLTGVTLQGTSGPAANGPASGGVHAQSNVYAQGTAHLHGPPSCTTSDDACNAPHLTLNAHISFMSLTGHPILQGNGASSCHGPAHPHQELLTE